MSLGHLVRRSWTGSAALGHTGFLGKSAAVIHIVDLLVLCLAANHTDSLQCHDRHTAVLGLGLGFGSDTDHTCSSASCLCLRGCPDRRSAGLSLSRRCSPHHTLGSRRSYLPSWKSPRHYKSLTRMILGMRKVDSSSVSLRFVSANHDRTTTILLKLSVCARAAAPIHAACFKTRLCRLDQCEGPGFEVIGSYHRDACRAKSLSNASPYHHDRRCSPRSCSTAPNEIQPGRTTAIFSPQPD